MGNSANNREHFNLYYIFLEDKLENALSEEKVEQMRKNILKHITELAGDTDSG